MGAKLSRRKSEGAAGTEGVAAGTPAPEKPAVESSEQKPAEAESAIETKPSEVTNDEELSPTEPAPGALEVITQAAEGAVSAVSEQIVAPVEDILNKGVGAVEAMMAAVSMKDEPTEPVAASTDPTPEPKPEPQVGLSEETTPKNDFSIVTPLEDPDHLPQSSPLEDLLLSEPIPETLLPEPISAATVEDITPWAENKAVHTEIEVQASPESSAFLVGKMQDAAPPAEPVNCEANVDPSSLNSDLLGPMGDMELGGSTVNDLI